tara:strand:- start:893 stop:1597 length:705 start_codon:yes stop_codon:yes gene_type:complete
VDEKFWKIGIDLIEHQETAHPTKVERIAADLLFNALFSITAVVVPILFIYSFLDEPRILVSGLFLGIPYALIPLGVYYLSMYSYSAYSIHIDPANNTIQKKRSFKKKEMINIFPLDEVKFVKVFDPFDDEVANDYIKIIGKNSQGVKWSLDITPFAKELYSQGKPSSDRRRIAAIKTAERYADLLGVEVASWVKLWHPKRELREEFSNDWVNHWTMGDTLKERNQRVISEEKEN